MEHNTFYHDMTQQNFSQLSFTWRTLIVIGSISTFIFFILLIIIVSLMFESKLNTKKEQECDLSEYDNFLDEFVKGKKEQEQRHVQEQYPLLPKIKDFDGNILKNLMQIDIIP